MKRLFLAVCLVVSFSAHAREKACRAYEFAELNTFSTTELESLLDKYNRIKRGIGSVPPITAREVREDMDDVQNCKEEMERIGRLIESRKNSPAEKKSKKAKAVSDKS